MERFGNKAPKAERVSGKGSVMANTDKISLRSLPLKLL